MLKSIWYIIWNVIEVNTQRAPDIFLTSPEYLILPWHIFYTSGSDAQYIFVMHLFTCLFVTSCHQYPAITELLMWQELDGVSPIDNRPSTNKLHQFVRKKERKKMWHVTRDMWHVTRDTWHVTRDTWNVTWHVTHDMWHVWGVNILSKFQLPSSYGLWFIILWRYGGKGLLAELINESVTRLFIEQPRLHRVC